MVVQPGSPCLVRYIKRESIQNKTTETTDNKQKAVTNQDSFKLEIDMDLCQGHANCMSEAPEIFQVDDKGNLTVLQENPDNSLLKKAKNAAKYCPTSAIKIKQN